MPLSQTPHIRLSPALAFSLLAHAGLLFALKPSMPDVLARRAAEFVEVRLAAPAPLREVSPRPAARPPRTARAAVRPAPSPAPKPVAAPSPAAESNAPLASEPAAAAEPTPAETATTAPAEAPDTRESGASETAPIAEARYEVQGLHNPKPPYPLAARRQGHEGRVLLSAHVRADGSCGDVQLKQSSGHTLLDRSALDTVRRWRFLPASRAGAAVDSWVDVPIRFRLEDRV